MDFKNMTPIVVRSFHYDLNDEQMVKNEVNVSLRQVYQDLEDGSHISKLPFLLKYHLLQVTLQLVE